MNLSRKFGKINILIYLIMGILNSSINKVIKNKYFLMKNTNLIVGKVTNKNYKRHCIFINDQHTKLSILNKNTVGDFVIGVHRQNFVCERYCYKKFQLNY